MTDIVLRMKTLPDLTNEQAWAVVYEGAKEIEKLRADLKNIAAQKTVDELTDEGVEMDADFEGAYDAIIHIARRAMQPS